MAIWKLDLLYLAVGAIVGAYLRYKIANNEMYFAGIPVTILIINVLGSFILGASMTTVQKFGLSEGYVLLAAVGFCGSFTTMSSFAFETTSLLDAGKVIVAFVNVVFNVGLSIVAVVLGNALVSALIGLV